MTKLKIIQSDNPAELERLTNEFTDGSEVYAVVNMRIYPMENGTWVNYIVYKKRYPESPKPAPATA